MDSLFDVADETEQIYIPLAERMRPRELKDIVGQEEVLGENSFLGRMIRMDHIPSILLFGPPGCGKTSIASVVAKTSHSTFIKLNATSDGIKQIREIAKKAKEDIQYYRRQTIVFIDEIHRFSRNQQDALLPYVEDGTLSLIGATTENPYFEIVRPLLSRMRLIRLKALDTDAVCRILQRAAEDPEQGLGKQEIKVSADVLKTIAAYAGGDLRMALNLLEQSAALLQTGGTLTEKEVRQVDGEPQSAYDKNRDYHYDIVSAFIKSMRGSDPDAALHYLARMINGGEKPSFISRRIMICAAEDVGLADPRALTVAVSAAQAAEMIGFPEAQIPLAEAVLYICLAPKSNSSVKGVAAALQEAKTKADWSVPDWLRDAHYSDAGKLGHGKGYLYPHNFGGWVKQQYLPDELKGHHYYTASENGTEKDLVDSWTRFRSKKQE